MNYFTAFCSEILSFPLGAWSVWETWRTSPRKVSLSPQAEQPSPLVVLLHGSNGNKATMLGLVHRLESTWSNVVALQYDNLILTDRRASIDDYVQRLTPEIRNLVSQSRQKLVYFVGHSMGGLVAARLAQKCQFFSCPAIVTIGTPWQGSPRLRWFPKNNALFQRHENMRENSVFLQSLQLPPRTKVWALGATTDFLVPTPHAFPAFRKLEDPRNITLNGVGHLQLIFYPPVWSLVTKILDREKQHQETRVCTRELV